MSHRKCISAIGSAGDTVGTIAQACMRWYRYGASDALLREKDPPMNRCSAVLVRQDYLILKHTLMWSGVY